MWIQNNIVATRKRMENNFLRFESRFRVWGTAADGQLVPVEPFHLRSSSSSSSLSLLSLLLSPTTTTYMYFHLILFCRRGELHNDNSVRLSWIWDHSSCWRCLWPISGLSPSSSLHDHVGKYSAWLAVWWWSLSSSSASSSMYSAWLAIWFQPFV